MNLLPRRSAAPQAEQEVSEPLDTTGSNTSVKGRPTPKRRDSARRRPPITEAPRNRKEAYKWQKEQAARGGSSATSARSPREQREAMRRGDPTALPRRDQGEVRKLARDWVDSKIMLSNFLLLLFPVLVLGYLIPRLNLVVIVLFVLFIGDWYITGRRIRALALQRFSSVPQSAWSLGFYAGSRAYMPRKWRMPKPQVRRGDTI